MSDELYRDREDNLVEALIEADKVLCMCRIWGGMGWKYLNAPAFRVEKAHRIIRDALDAYRYDLIEANRQPDDAKSIF